MESNLWLIGCTSATKVCFWFVFEKEKQELSVFLHKIFFKDMSISMAASMVPELLIPSSLQLIITKCFVCSSHLLLHTCYWRQYIELAKLFFFSLMRKEFIKD